MRTETLIFKTSFGVDTAASFLERRVKANDTEAVAIIEDLHEHQLLNKLTEVIPKLSTNVLFAFSKAPAFQDLLITSSPSTNAPPIFGTQRDAFPRLLSALPRAKTRQLFLATTPERVAHAISTICPNQEEAFGLAISLELGNKHEDAVISILASTSSFQNDAADFPPDAANVPTDAANADLTNAGSAPPNISTAGPLPSTSPGRPVPASVQSSGTAGNGKTSQQPSVSPSQSTNASCPVTAAAPSTLAAKTAAPPEPFIDPTPSPDTANPAATVLSTRHTGANATQNRNAAAGVGDSSFPRPPANSRPAPPRPAPATVPLQAMPTAALKARLVGKSTVNTQGAKDAAPPAKGKSSRKDTPQPSDDDSDEDSSAESSASGDSEDYVGSDSTDDDTPLAAPRGGSKAPKGKSAAAAQGVPTPDEDKFDPDEEIYGEAKLLTPGQFYEKYKASINPDLWEKLRNFPTSYQDEDSDRAKWDKKREKLAVPNPAAVDLPPIPREEAVAARKRQWGTEYKSILHHEKQQFVRLPPLMKELCGDSNNSSRHTADIHIRRFWAPYLYVNVCITEKTALTNANTQLLNLTLERFSHLKLPKNGSAGPSAYYRPIRNFFNTVKKRVGERFNGGVREPKVKQEQLERAISFMSGELRRAAAPVLWAKDVGAAAVKAEVDRCLAQFASEKGLAVDDKVVKEQRLGFRSSEISRLFRAQPDDVQEKYQKLVEDPNMDPTAFADSSALVLRSFVDAITEETGAMALCAFAVDTSQGPILVFSQHGAALQDSGWLQRQGTDFLQPFVKAASENFRVELGDLPLITAQPPVLAEKVDHPWAKRTSGTVSVPAFRFPIAEHFASNREILRSAILNAIRTFSGASPSMEAVVENVKTWIVPGTLPKLCPLMIDPSSMTPEMVEAWVIHWQESFDENSSLAPGSRLTFVGQAVQMNPPPLPAADDAETDADLEPTNAKGKGKARAKKAPSALATPTPAARRPSGLDVFVDITPPAGFNRSMYQRTGELKVGPPPPKKKRTAPRPAATSSKIPSATAGPSDAVTKFLAAAAAKPSGAVPESSAAAAASVLAREQNPPVISVDHADAHGATDDAPPPAPMDVDPPAIPPSPAVNLAPSPVAPANAQAPPVLAVVPSRRVRSVPPQTAPQVPLVEYASDPESPVKSAAALRGSNIPLSPPFPSFPIPPIAPETDPFIQPNPQLPLPVGPTPSSPPAPVAESLTGDPPSILAAASTTTQPAAEAPVISTGSRSAAPVGDHSPASAPSKKRPRPAQRSSTSAAGTAAASEGRSMRDAPVLLKEMVTYDLSRGKDEKKVQDKLKIWADSNAWAATSFSSFMADANRATQFSFRHSSPLLQGRLAPLLQGALVTAWYSAVESPEENQTSRKHRFKLTLPWHNLAANSPADHVFQLLLDPTKPLPLLSSLLAPDGGWALSDVSQFLNGLVFSVEVAFNNIAAAPVGLLAHSWVDAVPIARAIAFLRSSRALQNVADYSGPAAAAIDLLTDRVIVFVNAIAMLRYVLYNVIATVPLTAEDSAGTSSITNDLWKRYIDALSTILESIAAAAAMGRSDFFSSTVENKLPTSVGSVAQTIMRHPGWWYQFRQGKAFGPKPLEIQTRNKLLANRLSKSCAALTAEDWDAFSGLDRSLIAILLSIAILQEVGPDGPKEPTQIKNFTDDLTRIQAVVHQSNSAVGGSSGPLFPRNAGAVAAGSLDWGSDRHWASCGTMPARVVPEVDTDDEGELGPFSSGDNVDQEAVARDAAAITEGRRPSRSPKKSIFPPPKTSTQAFGSSPLTSPDHSPVRSSPAAPRRSTASRASSAASSPAVAAGPSRPQGLPSIPEDPAGSEEVLGSGNEEPPARKRKRGASKKTEKAKRARTDRSSDAEPSEGRGIHVRRSSRKATTPTMS